MRESSNQKLEEGSGRIVDRGVQQDLWERVIKE